MRIGRIDRRPADRTSTRTIMWLKSSILTALFTAALFAPAQAQYAADQARSLTGLQRVYIGFSDLSGNLSPETRQRLYERATLELRKAGVRILEAPWEGQELQANVGNDGLLNIGIAASGGGFSSDHLQIRMDVEQVVRMKRTEQELRLVTWYYEDNRRPLSWSDDVDAALLNGINRFLNDWLSSNGR